MIVLGLEGSANKVAAGIIALKLLPTSKPPSSAPHSHQSPSGVDSIPQVSILANIRKTYVTPPGQGFLPKDTAKHHRDTVVELVEEALKVGGVGMADVDLITFTKGPLVCGFEVILGRVING